MTINIITDLEEKVNRAIDMIADLKQNKQRIIFPWQMHILAKFLLCLPRRLRFYILDNRK